MLAGQVGDPACSIVAKPELEAGACLVGLTLGTMDIGIPAQHTRLAAACCCSACRTPIMPELARHPFVQAMHGIETATHRGRITRIMATYLEADGPGVSLGSLCRIARRGQPALLAEVARSRWAG